MAIPIFGMADHQVKLYEKNDVDDDEDQVSSFRHFSFCC